MLQIADLTKALVEKNVIEPGTTISALIPVKTFGDAVVTKEKRGVILQVNPDYILVSYEHGVKKRTEFSSIKTIEGMDISRFAQAYKVKIPKK